MKSHIENSRPSSEDRVLRFVAEPPGRERQQRAGTNGSEFALRAARAARAARILPASSGEREEGRVRRRNESGKKRSKSLDGRVLDTTGLS